MGVEWFDAPPVRGIWRASKDRPLWWDRRRRSRRVMAHSISIDDVYRARERIRPVLGESRLERLADFECVHVKLECNNPTRSFKIRGAINALQSLPPSSGGLIACSSGNHAQSISMAYSLQRAAASAAEGKAPAVVLMMPKGTAQRKIDGVRSFGVEPTLFGDNYDETELEALRRAKAERLTFVSPYNNLSVIAGAGTVGLEILDQRPTVQQVVVCLSGGGLLSGVSFAIKSLRPDVRVVGVCAESAPGMYNALTQEKLPEEWHTLADALSGDVEAGSVTIDFCRKWVDDVVLVSEEMIASTMRYLALRCGWITEGGGAVAVAALLHNVVAPAGFDTVAVVSGANVDPKTLLAVLNGANRKPN